ncbi:winged helix-turn-helix domain-containing protein [Sphingomonas sp. NFR15]|uniref:ATP-binding protein n=1 Tax=Sphingomonas sp. NFR15 TaxID=1566282 RepID=UPI000881E684|nr:winged helix-turn-helix domain-containing protein [Sphingomonas sp. NFR15]SDA35353.1 Predicted ATPase [Sphingomonas sp. NFR15]
MPEHGRTSERVRFGPFCLSTSERLLTRDGVPVEIGGRSFDLLAALVEQPGRVLSKRELLKRVWSDVVVEDGSLRFHMAGLRKLLGGGENGARYIATQVGVGYAFVAPVEAVSPSHAAAVPAEVAAPSRPAPTTINMPARLPHLIGRDTDLALLTQRIVGTPLFTIVGPAGVGKTTLAVEIAHRLGPEFGDQVTFVDFSQLEDPALVAQMIAGAMMIAVQSDDPLAVILGHIRDKKVLLLLDNCEHVIEPVSAIVERIVAAAPGARILATSREPMRVRGEHVHRLDALAYPERPESLGREQLLSYPAIQLFCERALAGDSTLQLDEAAARLIADMCRRLDGMALPIELTAVRAATHGIEATARLLGDRFSLGWHGHRTATPRQQTLQATLDWSYDLLSGVEQIVLARLAVFVGLFSIDAALDVVADERISADEVAAALDELASKSLVVPQRARGMGTYRLLEMTRAYAREKLLARGADEARATARRHASFYFREIDAAAGQDAEALHDLRALRQQLGNIRSALDWAFGPDGDARLAVLLAAASAPVFLNLSSLVECRTWCARALSIIQDEQRGTSMELELQASLGTALMFTRGNSHAAGAALSRALEVASALDDIWNELRLLGRLHIFHERLGDYADAFAHAERAVRIATAIGEPEALGVAYSLSGISHHLAGDQTRARRELELSRKNSAPSRRERTIHYGFDHRNRATIALARALWLTGDADHALRMAKQAVHEAERLDHAVTRCIALVWSFSVHLWAGDVEEAERALAAFADCADTNALGPYIAATDGLRGELALARGDAVAAVGLLEESLSRLRAARYELLTTPFSLALARGLIRDGRWPEAHDLLIAAIGRCETSGERILVPELLRAQAEITERADNSHGAAADVLRRAITLARKQGAVAWERRSSLALAAL